MKRWFIITLVCIPPLAWAGGPVYSRFGVGDLKVFGSNRAFGMGILGISLTGDGYINSFNPACLARISLTRIGGGYEFSSMTLTDEAGSAKFSRGDFQSLSLAIPISRDHGIVLAAEAIPYSAVHYKVEIRQPTAGSGSLQKFSGSGGLSKLSLAASYAPRADLSLGAKYSYVFGTIDRISAVQFDDPGFSNSELRTSLYHGGSHLTFGIQIENVGSLLGVSSLDQLQFGMMVSTSARLSVRKEDLLLTSASVDTVLVSFGTTELPLSFGIGLAYLAGDRLLLSTDAYFEKWEGTNFFGISAVGTRNSMRVAAGAEFMPKPTPITFGDRVAYRAGFAYNSTYQQINGQPVNEWYISGGIGLPIGPDARLNLTMQAGVLGTTANGLQKSTFFRFSFSVSASEAWFIPLQED